MPTGIWDVSEEKWLVHYCITYTMDVELQGTHKNAQGLMDYLLAFLAKQFCYITKPHMLISIALLLWLLSYVLHCFKNLPAKVHKRHHSNLGSTEKSKITFLTRENVFHVLNYR